MTRTGDVAIPDVDPHPLAPGAPLARWVPWRPVIALELLPQAAYVWDDADDAVVWDAPAPVTTPGYLTPTVGNASTPDTPADHLTGSFRVRACVRAAALPTAAAAVAMQRQAGAANLAWDWRVGTAGQIAWRVSSTGTGFLMSGNSHPSGTVAPGADVWVGVRHVVNGTTATATGEVSDDGTTWRPASTFTQTGLVPIDSTAPISIGGAVSGGALFPGAIRWAQVETLDAAGNPSGVIWRFDADDYPGTGLTYVDPRGRAWTLSAAGAITPAVRGEPPYVWDAPFVGGGFTDAACDFVTLDVDPGEPDDLFLFPAVSATLTLANPDGAYTPWSADGRLVYWAPGRRFAAYWWNVDTDEERWMFSGRVASWTLNVDGTVTVVAYDGMAALAQGIGPFTPGVAGDTPRARILAIAATAQYPDPVTADVGDVTLSTAATTDAPLEQIETAALSDGGLFYGDADGSLRYRDRLWRAGRDDQPRVWTVSDNVCTVPVVVWDPEAAADDERLATVVRLANVAGLIAQAAVDATLWAGDARFVLTHPDPDQWQTQADGDALAAYLLAQQSTPSMAVNGFDLYGLDPRQPAVADFATGLRRGDRVNVLHDFIDADGNPSTLDVTSIALAIAHNLTPESWVSHVRLSRTVDYRTVELWDQTVFTWDQDHPSNVWRY